MCISFQFSRSVVSNSLWPHGLQHARPPCPSPTPRVYSNSCSLSRWCHPTISSSVIPFSSHLQSFPTYMHVHTHTHTHCYVNMCIYIKLNIVHTSIPSHNLYYMDHSSFLPLLTGNLLLPGSASGKEPACQWRRHKRCRFDHWVRKIPYRIPKYSFLENPTDRGALWATVHRVTKSRTWLKQLSKHAHKLLLQHWEINHPFT